MALLTLNDKPIVIKDSSSGGVLEPATLTITSNDYTDKKYATFAYFNNNEIVYDLSSKSFTLPFQINTYVNCAVLFAPSGWSGFPRHRNLNNCLIQKLQGYFYIVPTGPNASVEIYNDD